LTYRRASGDDVVTGKWYEPRLSKSVAFGSAVLETGWRVQAASETATASAAARRGRIMLCSPLERRPGFIKW
jgi:hypothetical protein